MRRQTEGTSQGTSEASRQFWWRRRKLPNMRENKQRNHVEETKKGEPSKLQRSEERCTKQQLVESKLPSSGRRDRGPQENAEVSGGSCNCEGRPIKRGFPKASGNRLHIGAGPEREQHGLGWLKAKVSGAGDQSKGGHEEGQSPPEVPQCQGEVVSIGKSAVPRRGGEVKRRGKFTKNRMEGKNK